MFAILFGLSMDYEVFLLSQIQEHYREDGDTHDAVVEGLANTGRVITSAALIMVFVFTSFVLNGDPVVKEFGLGWRWRSRSTPRIVRCLLVPAVMVLLGTAELVDAALARPAPAAHQHRGRGVPSDARSAKPVRTATSSRSRARPSRATPPRWSCSAASAHPGGAPPSVAARLPAMLKGRRGGSAEQPSWEEDEGFCIERHVGEAEETGPCGGGGAAVRAAPRPLAALVADRPRHAPRGRAALVWRIHHALAEGPTCMRLADEVLGTRPPSRDPRRRRVTSSADAPTWPGSCGGSSFLARPARPSTARSEPIAGSPLPRTSAGLRTTRPGTSPAPPSTTRAVGDRRRAAPLDGSPPRPAGATTGAGTGEPAPPRRGRRQPRLLLLRGAAPVRARPGRRLRETHAEAAERKTGARRPGDGPAANRAGRRSHRAWSACASASRLRHGSSRSAFPTSAGPPSRSASWAHRSSTCTS